MFSLRETAPVVALAQALLLGLMLYGPDETTARENIQSVTGEKTGWVGQLPGDWLGGNEKELQSVGNNPRTDPVIAEVLNSLLPRAHILDVIYKHFNFDGGRSRNDALLAGIMKPDFCVMSWRRS